MTEAADLFKEQLTRKWTRKQLPHQFNDAWGQANNSSASGTGRIFQAVGLKPWLAYFLAKACTGKNYKGQASHVKAIAAFEKLPEGIQKAVATELLNTPAHLTVQDQIESISKRLESGKPLSASRRKKGLQGGGRKMTMSSTEFHHEEQRTQARTNTGVDGTMTIQDPSGGIGTNSEPNSSSQELPNMASKSSEQQTVSHPLTSRLPTIFPQNTCGVIRKNGDTAMITMVFPYSLSLVCLMSLSILPNKIQHLAMRLFSVHLEIENGFRYVILKDGVRLLPRPSLVIQGADEVAVRTELGGDVGQAISLSPTRREEIKQAILATWCVTMEISSNPEEDGVLNLNLGEDEGHQIRKTLFE